MQTMAKKKVKRSEPSGAEPLSFEEALAKLEESVARLEDGKLGLDASLAQYELGIKYLKQCYRQLEKAQRKIELLAGVDATGEVCGEPFDETDVPLEQKLASRSRRRSQPGSESDRGDGMDDAGTLF